MPMFMESSRCGLANRVAGQMLFLVFWPELPGEDGELIIIFAKFVLLNEQTYLLSRHGCQKCAEETDFIFLKKCH